MDRRKRRPTAARLAAAALALAALAAAGNGVAGGDHDHDRARQALEAGEILPLRTILERVERTHPGKVMEVELEREGGRWLYEIKLLQAGGTLSKLKVDARDGSVVEPRRRHREGEEKR